MFDNAYKRIIIETDDFYFRWASALYDDVVSVQRLDDGDYIICYGDSEDFLDLHGIFEKYNVNYDLKNLHLDWEVVS